jgi:DNA-directed RNA polymerase subunit F
VSHVADTKYITLAEVKQLLSKEEKQRELSPEQKLALDHAQKFSRLDMESVRKLRKELAEIGFGSDQNAAKIIDLLPTTPEDVRLIFSKERLTPEKKQIEQIIEAVRKYM